ncbi:MAG: MoaD/ThiS family protein [Crocinitomicaceae bacterium]
MTINVRYFGKIIEITGMDKESWIIDQDAKLADFKMELISKYPSLKNETFQLAVNQKLIDLDDHIHENAEIAVLPPFAGG